MGRRRRRWLCGVSVGEALTAEQLEARVVALSAALRGAGVPDDEIAALAQALARRGDLQ